MSNSFPIDTKDVQKASEALLAKRENVSVAESVTSGLLQLALSSGKKAMQYFQGGITAYNLGQKTRHLNVDPIHALDCYCVSEKVAAQMAEAACVFFSSDWGISVTGFASPVPESNEEVFAWFSISYHQKIVASGRIEGDGNRAYSNQLLYVEEVLKEFAKAVAKQ